MNENNMKCTEEDKIVAEVREFLGLKDYNLHSSNIEDSVMEMCVARMCQAIGVKCHYNQENRFFRFFSSFMGQAVSNKLNQKLKIAPDELRLFRYNGINFVLSAEQLLDSEDMDEAFIDAFNLADDNKNVMSYIYK